MEAEGIRRGGRGERKQREEGKGYGKGETGVREGQVYGSERGLSLIFPTFVVINTTKGVIKKKIVRTK